MPEPERGWQKVETQALSWLNLALGILLLAISPLEGTGTAAFWSAFTVGLIVVVLETFDEWAEHNDMEAEIVGPEAVVALSGLWLIAFPFLFSAGAFYQAVTGVIGAALTLFASLNMLLSVRLEGSRRRPPMY